MSCGDQSEHAAGRGKDALADRSPFINFFTDHLPARKARDLEVGNSGYFEGLSSDLVSEVRPFREGSFLRIDNRALPYGRASAPGRPDASLSHFVQRSYHQLNIQQISEQRVGFLRAQFF